MITLNGLASPSATSEVTERLRAVAENASNGVQLFVFYADEGYCTATGNPCLPFMAVWSSDLSPTAIVDTAGAWFSADQIRGIDPVFLIRDDSYLRSDSVLGGGASLLPSSEAIGSFSSGAWSYQAQYIINLGAVASDEIPYRVFVRADEATTAAILAIIAQACEYSGVDHIPEETPPIELTNARNLPVIALVVSSLLASAVAVNDAVLGAERRRKVARLVGATNARLARDDAREWFLLTLGIWVFAVAICWGVSTSLFGTGSQLPWLIAAVPFAQVPLNTLIAWVTSRRAN